MKPKRINYLEQSYIRDAIHECKKSYCWYADDRYSDFDIIVHTISDITPDNAREAMQRKADVATRKARAKARLTKGSGLTPKESDACVVDPSSYAVSDVVFRLTTDEHIPNDPFATGRQKSSGKTATNFAPFKHYITDDSGILTEVGRSHWEGSLGNGSFSCTHGKISNRLGKIYLLLTERLGTKGNYRGYTYLDEMKSQAIETLVKNGLKFDESKSDNAFAYLTVCCTNAFNKVLNLEKQQREIRDDMLQDMGMTPSLTRQMQNDTGTAPARKKGGRPRSAKPKPVREPGVDLRKQRGTKITAHGKTQSISEWAKELGLTNHTIYLRMKKGLSPEDCVAVKDFRKERRTTPQE